MTVFTYVRTYTHLMNTNKQFVLNMYIIYETVGKFT